MNTFTILASTASEGQIAQIARTFGVDWAHLGAQIISFGIVCAVLHRFAYRPILALLEQRREQIAQGIANAEKIKAELEATEAQRRDVLAQAHAQTVQIIEEARLAAARLQQVENQKAIAAAELIMSKASEAAARDHDRMLAELKREVGKLVVQATTTITGKILTAEDQQRLAEAAAKEIAT